MMPRRKRTRAHESHHRITAERRINEQRVTPTMAVRRTRKASTIAGRQRTAALLTAFRFQSRGAVGWAYRVAKPRRREVDMDGTSFGRCRLVELLGRVARDEVWRA
jgi:hypothetical protein